MSSLARTRRAPAANLLSTARAANRGHGSLSRARAVLERFEEAAEAFERDGRFEDAVAASQLGASMAAWRHPGVHVSVRLEAVLARIGARALTPLPPRTGITGRILHVASETYGVGGHTRMIWRWIDRDPAHAHMLVTTAQRGDVPGGLVAAVQASGGKAVTLNPAAPALARAQALRDLAAEADVVIVHAHPMDPIPTLAFAEAPNRPPVVVFNHADHLFWLGASIADILHCIRPVGAEIAGARGISAQRRVLTTAPVTGGDGNGTSSAERAAARADVLGQLGWPEDSIVLFSAGSHDKYRGTDGLTLLDLVEPVLRGTPRARLLVAGAPEDEAWRAARLRHGGRVAALGPVAGLVPLFAAADVYLESQPFGGPGASSEGAAHGLPVLTHAASEAEASLFCTDERYGATLAIGPGEYRRELARLVNEAEHRSGIGAQARERILATDAQWEEHVAAVYERAAGLSPASLAELAPAPLDETLDLLIAQCLVNTHPAVDPAVVTALAENVALAARTPALRELFGELNTMARAPERRIPLAVALPGAKPEALQAVVAEFLRLQAMGVADRFAIGLRPDEADAAVPVLEAALGDATIEIHVVVNERAAELVQPGCLEVVPPGAPGTGRAARHVCIAAPKPTAPHARRAQSRKRRR